MIQEFFHSTFSLLDDRNSRIQINVQSPWITDLFFIFTDVAFIAAEPIRSSFAWIPSIIKIICAIAYSIEPRVHAWTKPSLLYIMNLIKLFPTPMVVVPTRLHLWYLHPLIVTHVTVYSIKLVTQDVIGLDQIISVCNIIPQGTWVTS